VTVAELAVPVWVTLDVLPVDPCVTVAPLPLPSWMIDEMFPTPVS
jgi:hypothetical protein